MKEAIQVSYAFLTPLLMMIYIVFNGYPSTLDGFTFVLIYFLILFLLIRKDIMK